MERLTVDENGFGWTGQTVRIDIADVANTTKFDISDDGRYIVFDTIAALAANDTNATRDIYVYDTTSQSIALVSQSDGSALGDGLSAQPAISGNTYSQIENLTGWC